MKKIDCPTCGTSTEWSTENAFRPFCCERCKLIDLGEWAKESYQIPVQPNMEEYEDFSTGMDPSSQPLNTTMH